MRDAVTLVACVVFLGCVSVRPASAQVERVPGPEIVNDPKYLAQDFVTSTHFRREPDSATWDPAPCEPI